VTNRASATWKDFRALGALGPQPRSQALPRGGGIGPGGPLIPRSGCRNLARAISKTHPPGRNPGPPSKGLRPGIIPPPRTDHTSTSSKAVTTTSDGFTHRVNRHPRGRVGRGTRPLLPTRECSVSAQRRNRRRSLHDGDVRLTSSTARRRPYVNDNPGPDRPRRPLLRVVCVPGGNMSGGTCGRVTSWLEGKAGRYADPETVF